MMPHTPPDIVIVQSITWLSQAYVLGRCSVLTEARMRVERSQYKASVSPSLQCRDILPDTKKAWRWARINDTFYYAYNNIPNKAPQNFWCQFPPEAELKALAKNTGTPITSASMESVLLKYVETHNTDYLTSYQDCTQVQQQHLCRAAALAEAAINYIRSANVNIKKYTFFEQLGTLVDKHQFKYFPSNPRVIKRKLTPVIANGNPDEYRGTSHNTTTPITSIITLPRANNQNASGDFNHDEIRSWILQLRHDGRNLTNAYIIRKIQKVCALAGKICPKDRWIGGVMEEHNTKWLTAPERFGKKNRGATMYDGYQPFANALHSGDCWQVDGTRVNMIPHATSGTPRGLQYLYIIAVRDVHSGYILGYDLTITESHYSVTRALQMAAETAGHLPYELVCDKFPGHNTPVMQELLAGLQQWGMKLTFSTDPNSKAHLERWFGTLQTVFMQDSRMYYGQGIRSTRLYAHRSAEYLARARKDAKDAGWDFDAACAETIGIIDRYNNTSYSAWSRKHKSVEQSPLQLHQESDKPYVTVLQPEAYTYLFGIKKPLPHVAGLIKTDINNTTYYYWIKDYEVISKHAKVLCCFNYADLSSCDMFAVSAYDEVPQALRSIEAAPPIRQYLGRAVQGDAAQPYGPQANWGLITKRRKIIEENRDFAEQEYAAKTGTYDIYDEATLLEPMSVNKATYEATETRYLAPSHIDTPVNSNNPRARQAMSPAIKAAAQNIKKAIDAYDDAEISFNPTNQY